MLRGRAVGRVTIAGPELIQQGPDHVVAVIVLQAMLRMVTQIRVALRVNQGLTPGRNQTVAGIARPVRFRLIRVREVAHSVHPACTVVNSG